MKTRNFLMGLLFSLAMVRTAAAMGAPDAAYDGGGGPASLFLTVLPVLLIIGFIVLWIMALIRVIKSLKCSKDATVAIVALVLLILLAPIGIIVSFAAVKPVPQK